MKEREYISRDSKAPSQTTKFAGIIFGLFLIAFGAVRMSLYSIVIGAILLLALGMEKKIAMNEVGLVTT